jgi:DNA polymerase III delta prime subunit
MMAHFDKKTTAKKINKKLQEPEIIPESDDFSLGTHPRKNHFLAGHENAVKQFVGYCRTGRLPQALLVTGTKGIGKATLIYHFIRAMERVDSLENITEADIYNDIQDDVSRRIGDASLGNLLIIRRQFNDRGKFNQNIAIDDIRKAQSFFRLSAFNEKYRYCVVDCVDDMIHGSNAVPNAFLKTLEEPPKKTIFFLIAHQQGNILPTIKSRCQMMSLSGLQPQDFEKVFASIAHLANFPEAKRQQLMIESAGSVRQAMILATPVWGQLLKSLKHVLAKNIPPHQIVPIKQVKDAFYNGTSNAESLSILHFIFLKALSSFMKYQVMNSLGSSVIFYQTELYDKWHQLFLTADEYNLTAAETFDTALQMLHAYGVQIA